MIAAVTKNAPNVVTGVIQLIAFLYNENLNKHRFDKIALSAQNIIKEADDIKDTLKGHLGETNLFIEDDYDPNPANARAN